MLKTRIVSILSAALSAVVGASAAQSSETSVVQAPANGVDAARGDEWIYLTEDSLTGESLSEVEVVVTDRPHGHIDTRLRVTDSRTGMVRVGAATFDGFWRRFPDDPDAGQGTQDSWGVRPGLRVGEDWTYDFERQLGGEPVKMRWIGHGEALAIEPVDLPNGSTFEAMKIEFFERPAAVRYRFEMHVVEWFAPAVNRYVRREVETRLAGKIVESTTEILEDYVARGDRGAGVPSAPPQ